jgi:hypothetical protein
MDREAIEEAIEVLEDASAEMLTETGDENYYVEAIAVLRQALETEQEPVAFINVEKQKLEWAKLTSWHTPTIVNLPKIPLYTSPPKRKPLTHPQIHELDWPDGVPFEDILLFARAIEAAHGIKEEA